MTPEIKEIFYNGNEIGKSDECVSVSLMETYNLKEVSFYLVKYWGNFSNSKNENGVFACFFSGCDVAETFIDHEDAKMDAFFKYQQMIGKKILYAMRHVDTSN